MRVTVDVKVDRHPSGLLYAHSGGLKGLLVIDRSRERVVDALPGAIEELVGYGRPHGTVSVSNVEGDPDAGSLRYEAEVRA